MPQRRMAAALLKCGESRIWIADDPKIRQAITRSDVRKLISSGLIKKLPEKRAARLSTRKKLTQKVKGRRKGHGSRKGTRSTRIGMKTAWLKVVRPQRALLQELRGQGAIEGGTYRMLYRMIKGRSFRSRAHLQLYLKERGLLKVSK